MEVNEFFDLLESNKTSVVDNIKELIQENMHSVKESWLVNGLFDYFLQSNSDRCMDILIGVSREPHDKFLIDRITEGLRAPSTRKASLRFLGYLVRKQPSWLYKIVGLGLVKELITILKSDTDIVVLLTGLLIIASLLPILPIYLIKFTNDVFDIFGRLTTWAHTSHNIPEEHLLHLQVGLYSLFHRLYAMYPCNFLSYLRHTFGNGDKRVVFTNTIKPMLETVKMHPMLVTASKEEELSQTRWKNKEYDEIIAECALVSLDVLESGLAEEVNPIQLLPRMSMSSNLGTDCIQSESVIGLTQILRVPVSSLIQQSLKLENTDLSSLAALIEDSAPPTPSSLLNTTTSHHPLLPSTSSISVPAAAKSTASPPETAMEATPENTPMQTPIKDRHPTPFKLPTSPAVKHINFGKHTPPGSVPSSPAPHTADSTRRDSIFDTNAGHIRRDSLLMGRLEKIMIEQQQGGSIVASQKEELGRRPVPLNLNDCHSAVVGSVTGSIHEAVTGTSVSDSLASGGGPLTPMLGFFPSSDLNMEIMEDLSDPDELRNLTVPMPDRKSMMAFAQRVKRLRFYSQCADQGSSGGGPSPGSSPSSTFLTAHRIKRSNSCPDVYKKITEEAASMDSLESIHSPSSHPTELSTEESTPRAEALQPYEHLFEGVLPNFLQHPGENSAHVQSPHHLLDICIRKAAALHGMSNRGDELSLLRGQVELLHAQLLFERHRREAHALRNRSLAKRCRNIQQQEEKNYASSNQLNTCERELGLLKKELTTQRNICAVKEKDLQSIIASLETKLGELSKEVRLLKELKVQEEAKFSHLTDEFHSLQKEIDQGKADIFRLENEVKHCKKYVTLNAELKNAYETSQKEILLLGELYRRQQEFLMANESNQYILQEMDDLQFTCANEVASLRNLVEQKSSQTEAALGLIQDLHVQLDEKELVIAKQKKLVHDASSEYDIQIKALEDKYEAIKSINHRLELEILNLQHQLTMKTYTTRANSTRRISPPANGDSPHNSNNSDVDSATSAGGFQLSPEQSVFIFGSPQFGTAPMEMNDLQRVIETETADRHSPRRSGRGQVGGTEQGTSGNEHSRSRNNW